MASPLLRFLAQARSAALRPTTSPTYYTLVLGNPSCDLDSFISATIYSFFHSHYARRSPSPQPCLHIPVLNLPSTSSAELWRLRPEFGTALRLALHGHNQGGNAQDDRVEAEVNKSLLENLVTISDIRSCASSPLNYVFSKATTTTQSASEGKIQVLLVDHNALSIPLPDISSSELSSRLDVVGCIDHHIDESSVPPSASPRIIRTGIGSCTTLVVQYLKDEGFWGDLLNPAATTRKEEDSGPATGELAKLSLAAILIDTANLRAEGKVSDLDRKVVGFLEEIITNSSSSSQHETHPTTREKAAKWDRKSFYEQISATRADSLSLLSLPEIFNRDYKAWSEKRTETSPNSVEPSTMHLGMASTVKPVSWLISKADGSSVVNFVRAMRDFATRQDPALDLFALMTVPADAEAGFQRELLLLDTGRTEASRRAVQKFHEMAGEELGLEDWEDDQALARALGREEEEEEEEEEGAGEDKGDDNGDGGRGGALKGRIWWQRNVIKSRKQVAPLLREAMRSV
ncbi:hypothetical protein EPUS_07050 [Endocarpon pusillum Z07020]|uniref:DHHA2 domain-containing protein n=1 Tax=Endocarpon pusillum (strain Z07020 / HMAS-L-300199) TaxID=1263415 RepID=U1HLC5_ENDPU|nr:uncharacterized protein EPUS_07050 [Endocarpon pusillum Z07020]ERF69794.1 hypothetical protein EPUS_07050 [Endocarpon pusillum Z07020]